ncbi:MAG TPA: enoyl-CoA hydratase-related protein [Ilumatobacter sp.]|nr:enoyl-CoA hydratase-related protein [Ilumatobacter sp.]
METIDIERRDGIAIVRLDRPPVNAVNKLMMREIRQAFDDISQDRSVGAAVLTAAGERAFCGGIDLKETAADETPAGADMRAMLDPFWEWRQTQHSIRECLVPVVAAVERITIGAGFGLIGVCDLVIASNRASFGLTEINVGLLGGASKALRLLGPSKARRMLFLGEMVSAAEFHRLGGIEEVVDEDNAEARAIELAMAMAAKSPIAMRLAKESILRIEGDHMMQQYRTENDYTNRLRGYNDSAEAMQAFLEKRSPNWTWS